MGPLSYMRSAIDRNFVMRRIPVFFGKRCILLESERWLIHACTMEGY